MMLGREEKIMTPPLKDAAISFLNLAASGSVREAFRMHVGPGFRHHNPYFRGDAGSLMAAMEDNATRNPGKRFEVLRAIQEADQVAVFSRLRLQPGHAGVAVVHIFRFEGPLIAELWDIGQAVPEDSVNENGMF